MFELNLATCVWTSINLANRVYISTLAGFIYAFAFPVIAQTNHIQLMPRFIFPVAFYFLVMLHKQLLFGNFHFNISNYLNANREHLIFAGVAVLISLGLILLAKFINLSLYYQNKAQHLDIALSIVVIV